LHKRLNNKLAIAAHSAIVLVCIGGLLDGDMIVKAQMWLNGKTTYTGGGLIMNVPAQQLAQRQQPDVRANLLVAEGGSPVPRCWNQSGGVLLQELPFPSS
jgi:cytochrome c biogenesis protein